MGVEILDGLSAADQLCGAEVDEDFGGAGTGVVVRGLGHAVGSGIEEDDEVVGFDCGESAVAGEEVSGFADGAYYVNDERGLPCRLFYRNDLVVGVVERGADEIVHGGVGDDEGLAAVFLYVEDASEEGSGLGYDEAAGFEEQVGGLVGQALRQSGGVFFYLLRWVEGGMT